jgi:DNA-binding FrmR family transcriptional regulator
VKRAPAMPEGTKRALERRLRRIEGQVRGLRAMIADDRYCIEVMTQISAVHESLRGVGKLMLENHLATCASDAARSGDAARARAMWAELTKLFYRHAR